MSYRYLFGPVASRRLGSSLGIDLIPPKTCTLNCQYCECGATTHLSVTRTIAVPTEKLIAELTGFMQHNPSPDCITLAGSGEPTLAANMGEIVSLCKDLFPGVQTALITNGTLFSRPDVRTEAYQCDLVLPSLDAATQEVFEKINRPHPSLSLNAILQGMEYFSRHFAGMLWLEIFILPGINDSPEELNALAEIARRLHPGRIQLNSLDRPGTVAQLEAASHSQLAHIKEYFQSSGEVEIVSREGMPVPAFSADMSMEQQKVLDLIRRRPSTLDDLCGQSGVRQIKMRAFLEGLEKAGNIISRNVEGKSFYSWTANL